VVLRARESICDASGKGYLPPPDMAQPVKRGLLSVACVSRRIRTLVCAFVGIAAGGTGLIPTPLSAQASSAASGSLATGSAWATPDSTRRVDVAPDPTVGAGWLKRWLLGPHYRTLWTLPIRVEVLDLGRFAGGLTPIKLGGGRQTRSLQMRGGDGRSYRLRSVRKDWTDELPEELRRTIVGRLANDQLSALHPASALIVAPLLEAAGVRHVTPLGLFLIPDDPRLGTFRSQFAGMLVEVEERPEKDLGEEQEFEGATTVVKSTKLWKLLQEDPKNQVDSRAFLTARLMDMFVGDWDRGAGQWLWARFDKGDVHRWEPIPRDRDEALSRFDGVALWIERFSVPNLVVFRDHYGDIMGLTWVPRIVDRRLLADLEKPVWDSVAAALQAQLSDSAIERAVRAVPAEEYQRDGTWMTRTLKARRDRLHDQADRFYRLLAWQVDLHATDKSEVAEVDRHDDGSVTVRLSRRERRSERADPPYYRRTFRPGETAEVRLYLHGGADQVVARGHGPGTIRVRIIAGPDATELVDSSRAGVQFYDPRSSDHVVPGPGTSWDRHGGYREPPSTEPDSELPRDWGTDFYPAPEVSVQSDMGLIVGGGPIFTKYGFRSVPYRWQQTFSVGFSTAVRRFRAEYLGDFRAVSPPFDVAVAARASGLDVVRFYGFGNMTAGPEPSDFFKVGEQQYAFAPSLVVRFSERARFDLGPVFKYARTDFLSGTLISALRPYGVGSFGELGAQATLGIETRDHPNAATRGVAVNLGGSTYPGAWDVRTGFAEAHGVAATYLTAHVPTAPTLALRVGGKKVWGTVPFQDAVYVGGASTLRGYAENRFAGDAGVYGNAELRFRLSKLPVFVPWDFGLFGLADAGRVFVSGETSDRWHAAGGGGVWLTLLQRALSFSLALAHGERTHVYFQGGFAY
jgi:surface antigen Omp85-like protein